MQDYVVIMVDTGELFEVKAKSKSDALIKSRKKFNGDDKTWFECTKKVVSSETYEMALEIINAISAIAMFSGIACSEDFLGKLLNNEKNDEGENKE